MMRNGHSTNPSMETVNGVSHNGTSSPIKSKVAEASDQYADGRAAKLWGIYIGDQNSRTEYYRNFLMDLLRKNNCQTVLDVACGTGIDSVMLVEEGFRVTSVDASDKMLKYALKTRWSRRKEPNFDNWVIDEANWLTLPEDIEALDEVNINNGCNGIGHTRQFDALVCLGNSFAHLPDATGDQRNHKLAFQNFAKMVRPGGIFIIDHRNYDSILDSGRAPSKNIYYNSDSVEDIHTSVLWKNGKPSEITLDYIINTSHLGKDYHKSANGDPECNRFRLSYYPHRLESFSNMLKEAFGSNVKHQVYGDFKPLNQVTNPAFYVHVIEKSSD